MMAVDSSQVKYSISFPSSPPKCELRPSSPSSCFWRVFFTSLYNFPASFKGSNFIHTDLPHLPAHKEDSPLVLSASSMRKGKREFWFFFFSSFFFVSEYTTKSCALSSHTVHLHLPPLSSHRADLPINLYISFIFLLGAALLPEGWKKDGGNWTHFHHYTD